MSTQSVPNHRFTHDLPNSFNCASVSLDIRLMYGFSELSNVITSSFRSRTIRFVMYGYRMWRP